MATRNFSPLVPGKPATPLTMPQDEVITKSAVQVFDAALEFSKLREDIRHGITSIRQLLEDIQQRSFPRPVLHPAGAGQCSSFCSTVTPHFSADGAKATSVVSSSGSVSTPSLLNAASSASGFFSQEFAPKKKALGWSRSRLSITSESQGGGLQTTTAMGSVRSTLAQRGSVVWDEVRSTVATVTERQTVHRQSTFQRMCPDSGTLDQIEYDVCNYYHEKGYSQCIARSQCFTTLTFVLIMLNTIYIGIDADWNPSSDPRKQEDATLPFVVCDNLFCIFFVFETFVRFSAFHHKIDSLKDMWFKFDSALVALMIWETWVMPPLVKYGAFGTLKMIKAVRLLRLARMARFMRAVPELVAMIKGLKVAARTVGSAILMLLLLLYAFSLILFMQMRTEDPTSSEIGTKFETLRETMWTLLCDGVFIESFGKLSRSMLQAGKFIEVVILTIFVMSANLTVLNMLIGMLCEVVSTTTKAENEIQAVKLMKKNILVLLKDLDEDNTGAISREEMAKVLNDPDALDVLAALGVRGQSLLENLDWHFAQKSEVGINEIMNLILLMRGDGVVTVKNLTLGESLTRWKIEGLHAEVAAINEKIDSLLKAHAGL